MISLQQNCLLSKLKLRFNRTYVSILNNNACLVNGGIAVNKDLKTLIIELETDLARILVNVETLQYAQVELARLCQQLDEIKEGHTSILHLPNYSTLFVLDELLFYTVRDLMMNYESVSLLVEKIHTSLQK